MASLLPKTGQGPYTVEVQGLRQLLRVTDRADKETKKYVRDEFRKVAEPVRAAIERKLDPYDTRTAGGWRIYVRRTGVVSVEQSIRRTTGQRQDFAELQVRKGSAPALRENVDGVMREINSALARIESNWGRGG